MLIPLSPTNIRDLSCAFKFHQLRVLGRWPKMRSTTTFIWNGRAAHAVFADLFDPQFGALPPHRERLALSLSRAVAAEPYPDEVARRVARGWISGLVEVYLEFHDPNRRVLAVEQNASFPLFYQGEQVAHVSARLDRLEVHPDEPETLILVDLAMGSKPLTIHQVWMDLACAKQLYRGHGFQRHRLEVHFITSDDVQVTAWQGNDLKGVHLEVGALAAAFLQAVRENTV
jgi:hypothetical protein